MNDQWPKSFVKHEISMARLKRRIIIIIIIAVIIGAIMIGVVQ